MKIIIAGAGDVGFHLARLLSNENQDIVLIDTNQDVLDYVNSKMDVMTIRGDCSSMSILEMAKVDRSNLVLAVTTSEKTNLLTASIAKKMGARQVIARVESPEYLLASSQDMFRQLGIDHIISPSQLAAKEIYRLLRLCSFTDVFEFEDGKINLLGVTLGKSCPLLNTRIRDINELSGELSLRLIAVLRNNETIIPKGDTILLENDHVYFITTPDNNERIANFVGSNGRIKVKRVMILGGTPLGLATAKILEEEYNVTLIDNNKDRLRRFTDYLSETLLIHGEPNNIDLLQEEGLENMDALISLTDNSETNIISCLIAKKSGVKRTIAQVENREYVHISQNIGVDTLINKKLNAANNIFRFVRKGKVEAITSLHGVDAEIIEFVLTRDNQMTKKVIRDLPLPEKVFIGCVLRGEKSYFPLGDFQMNVGDKVIVFARPEAIGKLEQLFN